MPVGVSCGGKLERRGGSGAEKEDHWQVGFTPGYLRRRSEN